MRIKPKCFISYSHRDREFLDSEVLPVLRELDISTWLDYEQLLPGNIIIDNLVTNIQGSDFIIVIQGHRSGWVTFELGAVLGQNKPILIITIEEGSDQVSRQFHQINFRYTQRDGFRGQLKRALIGITDNLIDKRIFNMVTNEKIIGVRVGIDHVDYEAELRFTADLIQIIKKISKTHKVSLIYTDKGSFKSFFSIDIKAFAELLEKIIFFVPEWQKRKAEVSKVKAETAKIESEASKNDSDRKINEAMALADLLGKYKNLGIRFQLDSDLILSINNSGELEISKPIIIDEDKTTTNKRHIP